MEGYTIYTGTEGLKAWKEMEAQLFKEIMRKAKEPLITGTPGEAPSWDPNKFFATASESGVAFYDEFGRMDRPQTNKEIAKWKKKESTPSKSQEVVEDQESTQNSNQSSMQGKLTFF